MPHVLSYSLGLNNLEHSTAFQMSDCFICMKTFDLTFHKAVKKYRNITFPAIPQTMADESWYMSTQLSFYLEG